MTSKARSLGNSAEKGIVERALAAGFRAFRQPLSGALPGFKGDVVIETKAQRILVESKVRALTVTTKGASRWSIDFDWLRKVIREASEQGFHHGALFARPKSSQDRYVLIEEAVYLGLLANQKRPK